MSEARAEVRDPDDDYIRTIHFEIQVPRIVRLLDLRSSPADQGQVQPPEHLRARRQPLPVLRPEVPASELSLDHVLPRSRGGGMDWENIVCACVRCNVRKGGRTPAEAGMKLIKAPVKPKTSPTLSLKLAHRKYQSWKTFLHEAYWTVEFALTVGAIGHPERAN